MGFMHQTPIACKSDTGYSPKGIVNVSMIDGGLILGL